jgi:hypothetical protein
MSQPQIDSWQAITDVRFRAVPRSHPKNAIARTSAVRDSQLMMVM